MLQLIHFLIAMVKSPSKTLAPKRKFGHLALEGGEDASSATAKLNNLTQFTQGTTMDVSLDLEEVSLLTLRLFGLSIPFFYLYISLGI